MLKHRTAAAVTEQDQLIAQLERTIAMARAGKLVAAGIITVSSGGLTIDCVGDAAPLVVGAAQMQRQLLEGMFPAATQAVRGPTTRLSS